jgi:hypothetical protein
MLRVFWGFFLAVVTGESIFLLFFIFFLILDAVFSLWGPITFFPYFIIYNQLDD